METSGHYTAKVELDDCDVFVSRESDYEARPPFRSKTVVRAHSSVSAEDAEEQIQQFAAKLWAAV